MRNLQNLLLTAVLSLVSLASSEATTWKANVNVVHVLKYGSYKAAPSGLTYSGVEYLLWTGSYKGGSSLVSYCTAKSVPLTQYGAFAKGTVVANPFSTYAYECVDFVRSVTGAPASSSWDRGVRVTDGNVAIGTAIATFSNSTTYAGHTGIFGGYISGDRRKFLIWDQNWDRTQSTSTTSAQPSLVSRHKFLSTGSGLSDSDNYYVIKTQ
jgi:hypothetical protein